MWRGADSEFWDGALRVHTHWRLRLIHAVETGESGVAPEIIAPDDHCDLGRWLATRNGEHRPLAALHSAFHHEAASVLRLALGGDSAGARAAMARDSAFSRASAALFEALAAGTRAIA